MRAVDTVQNKQFANELKDALWRKRRTQADIARKLGKSLPAVNAYFIGQTGLLTGGACELLAELGLKVVLVDAEDEGEA